jgi:hypothetical protein|tara:strand:- start:454 stop:645 length:192 start_codon:yes stop_codon:yes gene_type:complete
VKEEKVRIKAAASAVHKRDAELRRSESAMETLRAEIKRRKHAVREKEAQVGLDEKRIKVRYFV